MNNMMKLWAAIDDVMSNNEYYDDELETTVCELDEEQIYNNVLKHHENEIRFLTSETIKTEVHRFQDWEYRNMILLGNSLY